MQPIDEYYILKQISKLDRLQQAYQKAGFSDIACEMLIQKRILREFLEFLKDFERLGEKEDSPSARESLSPSPQEISLYLKSRKGNSNQAQNSTQIGRVIFILNKDQSELCDRLNFLKEKVGEIDIAILLECLERSEVESKAKIMKKSLTSTKQNSKKNVWYVTLRTPGKKDRKQLNIMFRDCQDGSSGKLRCRYVPVACENEVLQAFRDNWSLDSVLEIIKKAKRKS